MRHRQLPLPLTRQPRLWSEADERSIAREKPYHGQNCDPTAVSGPQSTLASDGTRHEMNALFARMDEGFEPIDKTLTECTAAINISIERRRQRDATDITLPRTPRHRAARAGT